MKKRALKQENERLEKALSEAYRKHSDLFFATREDEDEIKRLRDDLAAERKKYAALLEKYIAMMEKAANLHDPGVEMMNAFHEIENMLLAWYQAEGYNAWLGSTFEKIKKKYTGV